LRVDEYKILPSGESARLVAPTLDKLFADEPGSNVKMYISKWVAKLKVFPSADKVIAVMALPFVLVG
jgi:hypothetical protein